jgi:hypothetical protein
LPKEGTQPVKSGSVRVEKHVERVEEPPAIRRDGDVIIVPVVEKN